MSQEVEALIGPGVTESLDGAGRSAEGRDDKGIPVRDVGSVSHTGAIANAASRDDDEDVPAFVARALR